MIIRSTYIDYKQWNDELVARVAGRSTSGRRVYRVIEGVEPYMFIPENEYPSQENADKVLDVEHGYESFDNKSLKKLTVEHPKNTNAIEEDVSLAYESDIPFYRRLSIDGLSGYIEVPGNTTNIHIDDVNTDISEEDVNGTIEPRVIMADIEVLPNMEQSFNEMVEEAVQPITFVSAYDSYEDDYLLLCLDPERKIDTSEVREHLEGHWYSDEVKDSGEIDGEDYAEADITLSRVDTEKGLANYFLDYLEERQPDILSGWNWIDFDHRYIIDYFQNLDGVDADRLSDIGRIGRRWGNGKGVERQVDGVPGFDMMEAFCERMVFRNWRSRSLDYVSEDQLGIGKVDNISVLDGYDSNRSKLAAYSLIDTQLLVALDDKNDVHNFVFNLADAASVPAYDAVVSEMRIVDGYIMSRREDDEILPNAWEKDIDQKAGAITLSPSNGIKEWVSTQDVKSLYPSGMITANISTETLTRDPDKADIIVPGMPESEDEVGGSIHEEDIEWDITDEDSIAIGVDTSQEGIIPKYLKLMFKDRERLKDIRDGFNPDEYEYSVWDHKQNAQKVVMNATYGVGGNPYWRLSRPDMADAVTSMGRYVIWKGTEISADNGTPHEYGDTDSVMVPLGDSDEEKETIIQRGFELEKVLNEGMDEVADDIGVGDEHPFLVQSDLHGTDRHCLVWEFEKLYRRFFQAGKKKRYAGHIVWKEGKDKDSVSVTGFESERSDTALMAAELQPRVIEHILKGDGFSGVSRTVRDAIEGIEEWELSPIEMAQPGSVTQAFHEYDSITEAASAAMYSNKNLGYDFRTGDDPWWFPVEEVPGDKPHTDKIAIEYGDTIPDGYVVDREELIRKNVYLPLRKIINEVGWSFDEVRGGEQTGSLEFGGNDVELSSVTKQEKPDKTEGGIFSM